MKTTSFGHGFGHGFGQLFGHGLGQLFGFGHILGAVLGIFWPRFGAHFGRGFSHIGHCFWLCGGGLFGQTLGGVLDAFSGAVCQEVGTT